METPVQAPFPTEKEYPKLPADIVARNLGRMVVVYVVINSEGKPEQSRIIQSPNPLLNRPILEALQKWSFRPAEQNGKTVAVKSLLGIVLSAPR
jgi:TonB family protein